MSPERTAPNELIGFEEKPARPYQKATPPPSAKVILPEQRNFDTPLDRAVAAMVRHVTQQVLEGGT
jgi:hypothetical protein